MSRQRPPTQPPPMEHSSVVAEILSDQTKRRRPEPTAIVIFGAMFGAIGMALAAPLFAIGRIAVLRLYVEDRLADRG